VQHSASIQKLTTFLKISQLILSSRSPTDARCRMVNALLTRPNTLSIFFDLMNIGKATQVLTLKETQRFSMHLETALHIPVGIAKKTRRFTIPLDGAV
jgi:hypothetical protein